MKDFRWAQAENTRPAQTRFVDFGRRKWNHRCGQSIACVDAEVDGMASAKANGDDLYVTPNADDEEGVIDADVDLLVTAGSNAQVRMRATNTTGSDTTLYGWIDVNRERPGVRDPGTQHFETQSR